MIKMPGYNRSEIIKLLEGRKQFKEYNGEITTKNPKFKKLVDIYNSKVKFIHDTEFTALVGTAVAKMENLQNAQEGSAYIQKSLFNSIDEYQKHTRIELNKKLQDTANIINRLKAAKKLCDRQKKDWRYLKIRSL